MSEDGEGGERALRREKYWAEMGPQLAARLELARAELVLKYRDRPEVWPDGIGGWYRADDWAVLVGEDGGRRAVRIGGVAESAGGHWRRFSWEGGEEEKGVEAAAGLSEACPEPVEGERPWEAEGVSRRTWFYRKKREKGEGAG